MNIRPTSHVSVIFVILCFVYFVNHVVLVIVWVYSLYSIMFRLVLGMGEVLLSPATTFVRLYM